MSLPDCVMTTRSHHSFHLSQKFAVSGKSSQTSPPDPPIRLPLATLQACYLQTGASHTGWTVFVITGGVLFPFVPHVPLDQRSSVSALCTLGGWVAPAARLSGELCNFWQHPWPVHLLDAGGSPLPAAGTIKDVSRHCQMPSGGVTPASD